MNKIELSEDLEITGENINQVIKASTDEAMKVVEGKLSIAESKILLNKLEKLKRKLKNL